MSLFNNTFNISDAYDIACSYIVKNLRIN